MNQQSRRLALAAVSVFYVVIGGMWATNYFPLQKFYSTIKQENAYVEKFGYEKWLQSPEHKNSEDYIALYSLTYPSIDVTENKIGLYQSILLWGTVALGVGAAVLFLTRGKRAS